MKKHHLVHPAFALTVLVCSAGVLPASATPFADTLNPSSVTNYSSPPATFTTTSPVYSTNIITTAAGTFNGGGVANQPGTSHTWTSINDSYVPAGMTAPSNTDELASFGKVIQTTSPAYTAKNSDGKTGGQFLYTDYLDSQPVDTAGTRYGVQSVYLVSPLITMHNGSVVTFWTEGRVDTSPVAAQGGDHLLLRLSTSSSSTFNIGGYVATGSTTGSAGGQATYDGGDFSKTLLDINPKELPDGSGAVSTGTATVSGSFPTGWTQYSVTITGLPTSADNPTGSESGRFAFQYLETHANPDAADGYGNDVGIDDFTVDVPEPKTWLGGVLLLGGAGMGLGRRLRAQLAV